MTKPFMIERLVRYIVTAFLEYLAIELAVCSVDSSACTTVLSS